MSSLTVAEGDRNGMCLADTKGGLSKMKRNFVKR